LAPFKAEFSLEDYTRHLTGIPSTSSAQWIIDRFALPTEAASLYAQKQAHVDEYLASHAFPLMPYAAELVRYCFEAGLKLAVASGAGRAEIQRSLEAHGLQQWISVVASKDDVPRNKPAPDVYLLALKQLDERAAHSIAIEDSNVGQASALAAGLTCLRLHPGGPQSNIVAIESLADVQVWLEARINASSAR
jgi:beta-phosphoglucomutase-like phosphatase (HAD superfamily)